MPLDLQHMIEFFLNGTIEFPHAHETLRRTEISIESNALSYSHKATSDLITIVEDYGTWRTTRQIAPSDVAAVFIPLDADDPKVGLDDPHRWFFGREVADHFTALQGITQSHRPAPDKLVGQIFVPEQLNVIMHVEFTAIVTAKEGAEYCPHLVKMGAAWGC